jgi:hypothetical protein
MARCGGRSENKEKIYEELTYQKQKEIEETNESKVRIIKPI